VRQGAKVPGRRTVVVGSSAMNLSRVYLHALALAATLVCTTVAHAEPQWIIGQRSEEQRFTDLSFGAVLDGSYGFGFTPGVTLGIPLLDGGFIPPINDSLFLEPGLFVATRFHKDDTYVWVIPEFGPRWNFHLTPNWDAFATLKAGWAIGSEGGFWLRGTVGMNWWFARPWALRLETSQGRHGHHVGPAGYLAFTYQFG
jgi:hypothetical protein